MSDTIIIGILSIVSTILLAIVINSLKKDAKTNLRISEIDIRVAENTTEIVNMKKDVNSSLFIDSSELSTTSVDYIILPSIVMIFGLSFGIFSYCKMQNNNNSNSNNNNNCKRSDSSIVFIPH